MRILPFNALLIPLLLLGACRSDDLPEASSYRGPEGEVYHDQIQLGAKLEDPYTVANMEAALTKVYPTKAGRVSLSATDLYVRFLPEDDQQLSILKDKGLYLMDHPMDYQILREGDYYQDPEIDPEKITWQYSVVPKEFVFPEGIRYEVLDECYLSDHVPDTRAIPDVDWDAVEREAFRQTGNEEMLSPLTKGEAFLPSGRFTVEDPKYCGGKPVGLSGVMVVCNVFVKIGLTYTDRDGYYKMTRPFQMKPRYRIIFKNEKGFKIGFNWIIIPASVCTLGKGSPEGLDFLVKQDESPATFRRCAVNNAAYDYYSRCTQEDLDIAPPPEDLRFWIFNSLTSSSACMLHHGAYLEDTLLGKYLGDYLWLIKIFLPDITVGTKAQDYAGIYKAVVHELAHASHYARVGNGYWTPYIRYVIQSFITEGGSAYGSGSGNGAGYCEVGEMWGFFLQESLYKERYGGAMYSFGHSYWFKPDIFTYLYERGMSRGEIYRVLRADVTGIDDLRDALIQAYPEREEAIHDIFRYYGKDGV